MRALELAPTLGPTLRLAVPLSPYPILCPRAAMDPVWQFLPILPTLTLQADRPLVLPSSG